ncbi:hypothetical protein [Streptomyces sp. NPDC058683]|uniref:hypothetical protein n=1 Tax=Streptomyces sp. NPDC058683 TaxID=3346597 RepID=UPI00364C6FC0
MDGLLLLSTLGLLKQENGVGRCARWAVWASRPTRAEEKPNRKQRRAFSTEAAMSALLDDLLIDPSGGYVSIRRPAAIHRY